MLLYECQGHVGRLRGPSSGPGDHARRFTNVYIKNFPVEMTEQELSQLCDTFGDILSVKIMTDSEGNSRGFGFVSFESHDAAQACVEELNGKEQNGKQLFAGRAQTKSERSAELQVSFEAIKQKRNNRFQGVNLYIKNLDADIDDERLRKEFARFGNITSAKVMKNDKGVSRGFGFVCFSSQEEATKAVTEMNNRIISVKQLYVALAQRKEVRQAQLATQYMRMNMNDRLPEAHEITPQAVHVPRQLPLTAQMLAQAQPHEQKQMLGERLFSIIQQLHGDVADKITRMLLELDNAELLHMLESEESLKAKVSEALSLLAVHQQKKKKKQNKKTAQPIPERNDRFQGVKLHIKHLDDDIDDERLRKEFARFGNITSAKVVTKKGVSRGFGFVCFSSQEEATKAVTEMNNRIISVKPLYVALAQPNEVRQAQPATQNMRMNMNHSVPGQQISQAYPGFNTYYPQHSIYASQLAQVHNPRWPTPQACPTGQLGYQPMSAGAAHQFGAPSQFRSPIPRSVPVPTGGPSGCVPGVPGVPNPQTMRLAGAAATQRPAHKYPQAAAQAAAGPEGQQMSQAYPGFYQTIPPQQNIYFGQLAQVRHPQWPTAQARPTGQPGYQPLSEAPPQFGAPSQIRGPTPWSEPLPTSGPSGRVPGVPGVPNPPQRPAYKNPQAAAQAAAGPEINEALSELAVLQEKEQNKKAAQPLPVNEALSVLAVHQQKEQNKEAAQPILLVGLALLVIGNMVLVGLQDYFSNTDFTNMPYILVGTGLFMIAAWIIVKNLAWFRQLIFEDHEVLKKPREEGYDILDRQEATRQSWGRIDEAMSYSEECCVCYLLTTRNELIVPASCQCHICCECFVCHFTQLSQTTSCMYRYACPGCDKPDLESLARKEFQDYFGLLSAMVKEYVCESVNNLFQQKLMMWGLMELENFRWCVNGCQNGFLHEGDQLKVQCPQCCKYQCFNCNKQWKDQHEGISCEEFDAWKKANDPELQSLGLAAHLKENGIRCPRCKKWYELVKGGCMHFTCSLCQHQFCCGCSLPFAKYPDCSAFRTCKDKGLHAHHPRDCLYHLRDWVVETLQMLLQIHGVDFTRTDDEARTVDYEVCSVNLIFEFVGGMKEQRCGKPLTGRTSLCETHYKEYLVGLINQHKLDPVKVLTVHQLRLTLERHEKMVPPKEPMEKDLTYEQRLKQTVKETLPLKDSNSYNTIAATFSRGTY